MGKEEVEEEVKETKSKLRFRKFWLVRTKDVSGVSGTGYIAEGVKFTDGQCVISWLSDTRSLGIYHSCAEMLHIHGHGGNTVIKWEDELDIK
jgi:hypothetical protein